MKSILNIGQNATNNIVVNIYYHLKCKANVLFHLHITFHKYPCIDLYRFDKTSFHSTPTILPTKQHKQTTFIIGRETNPDSISPDRKL